MSPNIVKEETDGRIVLVDPVAKNILGGPFIIVFGLFVLLFVVDHDCESQGIFSRLVFISLSLFGFFVLFAGLYTLIIRETIIVDKRLQTVIVMKEVSLTHFKIIKKIPFTDLKAVEIMRNTSCENCDYASPVNDSSDSWNVSVVAIDGGSVNVYCSHSKSKSEGLAEKIAAISDKIITHQIKYTPPDYGGGG
jgi:hypothetical protein